MRGKEGGTSLIIKYMKKIPPSKESIFGVTFLAVACSNMLYFNKENDLS